MLALALLIQAVTVGLSDDEAYYWVLGQSPAWGYAFHPPGIGWSVWIFQFLLSWAFGSNSVFLTRLPAIIFSVGIFVLGLRWLKEVTGVAPTKSSKLIILAFSGLFALSWMIVPDLPLFLGWMIAFGACWRLCVGGSRQSKNKTLSLMCLGIVLAMLSKISGVFVAASCAACFIFLGNPKDRIRVLVWITLAVIIGVLPFIIWNATHHWGSLLYQIHDRHQGSRLSLIRYLRFWALQLFFAGPALFVFAWYAAQKGVLSLFAKFRNDESKLYCFIFLWAAPPGLIYLFQPLFSDFKPHWAFIVWWPFVLAMAASTWKNTQTYWIRFHRFYGLVLIGSVLLLSHIPLGSLVVQVFSDTEAPNPKLDVTNDFYGWNGLREFLLTQSSEELPVLGSRYQTAAQAAFSLGKDWPSTMIPRDEKAREEWPEFDISFSTGPTWPVLKKSVYYVADHRYTQGPEYPQAVCVSLGQLDTFRFGLLSKSVFVWRCEPLISLP